MRESGWLADLGMTAGQRAPFDCETCWRTRAAFGPPFRRETLTVSVDVFRRFEPGSGSW